MKSALRMCFGMTLALLGFAVVGCKKERAKSAVEIQEEGRAREIQNKVAALAVRHHARIDWSKGLEERRGQLWTIEVEDALKPKDGSAVVLVGEQRDILQRDGRYFIIVVFETPWLSGQKAVARAECSESLAREAAGVHKSRAEVAIVLNVQSVFKPEFDVEGEEGMTGDFLAIVGKCVDWLLLDPQD